MKIKTIKWRDSRMYIEQQSQKDEFDVCIIQSVGYVIHEDKEKVVLAGDILETDARRVIVIPKENIIK
jgi:hypothetical protein